MAIASNRKLLVKLHRKYNFISFMQTLLFKATYSDYTFFVSMCVPWELNPQPFAQLTQCSTTEPQEHFTYRLQYYHGESGAGRCIKEWRMGWWRCCKDGRRGFSLKVADCCYITIGWLQMFFQEMFLQQLQASKNKMIKALWPYCFDKTWVTVLKLRLR